VAKARIDRHSAVIEQDLPDIYAFIAERDPAAAERMLDAVRKLSPNWRNILSAACRIPRVIESCKDYECFR